MRQTRLIAGLAVTVCALALSATPALAHKFIASRVGKPITGTTPAKTSGVGILSSEEKKFEFEKTQALNFGAFRIFCKAAKAKGVMTEEEPTSFTTTITFAKCGFYFKQGTLYHVGAKFNKEGLKMVYHANGFAEYEGNPELEELEHEKLNGEIELLETAVELKVSASKLCKIEIPAQTIPVKAKTEPTGEFSSVTFKNTNFPQPEKESVFPEGFQKRLIIGNDLKHIRFLYAHGEGEQQCEEERGEEHYSTVGTYRGLLEEKIPLGNLSWE